MAEMADSERIIWLLEGAVKQLRAELQETRDTPIPDGMMLVSETLFEQMRDDLAAKHSQMAELVKAGLDLDVLREELEVTRQDLQDSKNQIRANGAWMRGQDMDIEGLKAELDAARSELGKLRAKDVVALDLYEAALRERDEAQARALRAEDALEGHYQERATDAQ